MPRYSRERVWTVFLLAVALCVLITVVRHHAQSRGRSDILTNASRRVLYSPVLHTSNSVNSWWQIDFASLFQGPELAAQNRQLRTTIATLMDQNRTLSDQANENSRLRSLLNFKTRDPRQLLPAEVLALKPFSERDSAIFSRGSDDDVALKQPALDGYGNLVGQVTAISSNTCDVLLLTDTLSSAGARVVTPSKRSSASNTDASSAPVGICVGDHSDNLQLNDLPPDADVQVGDLVVTSGLGGVYPKDIPIGRVAEVYYDKTRDLKSATVQPSADFDHLQEGFLLK